MIASPAPPVTPAAAESAGGASAAQRTIAVIGDAWTLRILRTVFRGQRRHSDFMKECGVSRAVLSDRLAKLVANAVLLRDAVDGRHPEYRLTERGLDLWSLFLAMWQWETAWGAALDPDSWASDLPRPEATHTTCGHPLRPQLRCLACRQLVLPFDTRAEGDPAENARATAASAGPGFRKLRSAGADDHPAAARTQRLARVIGDRWNSAVVAAAFRGTRLFARFQEDLQIGPAQLSDRLTELQDLGILRTRAYAGTRQEYRLTRAGLALFPLTLEMVRWGNRWLSSEAADPLAVRHLPCGHLLAARWHCDHCAQEIVRESVRFG
jgi:DNA-binding HxlR family transcriptional regulator